jgi:hypothetical protein
MDWNLIVGQASAWPPIPSAATAISTDYLISRMSFSFALAAASILPM